MNASAAPDAANVAPVVDRRSKGYRGMAMEGGVARWYDRLRGTPSQIEEARASARRLGSIFPPGSELLEVAPGPGYHAIELARLGFHVTALDISRTFVGIAEEHARRAAIAVDFRLGDASRMPFDASSFEGVVSQAAFKNFSRPVEALDEMHRVLRPGGLAVVQDMRKEATDAEIRREVATMQLGRFNAFMTRRTLVGLRRRAYTVPQFAELAGRSAFGGATITVDGIGLEVRLRKPSSAPPDR